jgi:hypothetical protein
MSSRVQPRRRSAVCQLRRAPGRPRPGRAAAWLAVLALAVTAVGCASQANVGLPPKAHDVASAAAATDPQPGVREQVLAAYEGYWQATGAAVNAATAGPARALLAPYLTPGAIPGVLAALRPDWAEHAVSAGSPVLHILSVKITGTRALVHDCVDLSQAGLADARTGRPYPRSFGSAHANFYADLVLSGSRWLVSNLVPVVAPCER